jgi:hypothetical protein
VLFRSRPPILVARGPALAEPREVAQMGHSLVPFPCYVTVRRAFGISYVLQPRCLPTVFVCASALQYFTSGRPGMCGRADVGLGNFRLSGSGSSAHNPDTLAQRRALNAEVA